MSKHDEQVKSMMAEVEKRKSELGSKPKGVLNTNGILKFNDKDHVNINTIQDVESVIKAYSYVLNEFSKYTNAVIDLGLNEKDHPFAYGGFSIDDWQNDFQLRLSILEWNRKEKQLNDLSKKLDALVSEDLRTENELKNIAKLLG
jgi:hypothetical protein